jgi:hypothetical protein
MANRVDSHMKKIIVIDKSVLQGTPTQKLKQFVNNHFLILPEVLYYECLTTTKNRKELLQRFISVVLSGGYVCPYFIEIVRREANSLVPFGFLVDLDNADEYRSVFRKGAYLCTQKDVQEAHGNQMDLAQKLIDWAGDLANKTGTEEPGFASKIRQIVSSNRNCSKRYEAFAHAVDSEMNIHKATKRLWPTITDHFEKFCISGGWFSWHFTRLLCIYLHELWRSRQESGFIGKETVEHNIQDIGYVVLLCRSDALLTRDKKLVRPLAKAAFPEKDIFPNIDQVPDEYICHWGQPSHSPI